MTALEVVRSGMRPTLDESFALGLHECYARHGLPDAVPVAFDEHALVRLVVVRDDNGVLLGGGRVHARHARLGFPAETLVRQFPDARARVRDFPCEDTVEITALWTTASSGAVGIARLVAQACLAAGIAMGKRYAFTVSHDRFSGVLAAIGMMALPDLAPLPLPTPAYRTRLFATELGDCKLATRCDREIIAAIASAVVGGTDRMLLNELTALEQGRPSWTIRRTTSRLRQVA
ncbi:MAG: hypothetical protein K1X88_04105 [Nannocystaceae bacterium]|nr:hypothetical protein [Nannocystaceae bacterium]